MKHRCKCSKNLAKRRRQNPICGYRKGGRQIDPILLYEYHPSRSQQVPLRLLEGFNGYLQTDGYEGYAAVAAQALVIQVGCWAHARRKFDEAIKAQGKTQKPTPRKSD